MCILETWLLCCEVNDFLLETSFSFQICQGSNMRLKPKAKRFLRRKHVWRREDKDPSGAKKLLEVD
jgi:hypothetical protein